MAELQANSRAAAPSWTDQKIEWLIGGLLRGGVLISGLIVLAGGILYLIDFAPNRPDYTLFRQERAALHDPLHVIAVAAHLDARALIQVGLMLLVATPVARVLFSVIAFWLERDRLYVWVSLIVLAILLFSIFGGTS